jgi:Resolvase, N terminal domain
MATHGYRPTGQSLDAQVKQLRAAGAEKVFRETASGARADRAQLRRVLDQLDKGDVLMVTRLDRLARSTRDLLNTLATITGQGAGFRSLNDTWADTTTPHGRLMLTVLGGLAEFERELRPHGRRPRARQGKRREDGPQAETHGSPEARSDQAARSWRGDACGDWPVLQCERLDDFEAQSEKPSNIISAYDPQKNQVNSVGDHTHPHLPRASWKRVGRTTTDRRCPRRAGRQAIRASA